MAKMFAAVMTLVLLVGASPAVAQEAGDALRFDGVTDYVALSTTSAMLGADWRNTKSVSVWVKPTGTAAACTSANPLACDAIFGDRPRSWGISRGTLNGLDRIWVTNFDGTYDTIGIEYTPGEWLQVALVHGGGDLKAYKNGALVGTVRSGPTPSAAATSVVQFGGAINNSALVWTFEGDIDEVQVWNAARTEAEIAASWNQPLTGTEAGLVAYYQMSDGQGTTVTDDTGHGWVGTLTDGCCRVPADGPITWVPSGAFGIVLPPPNTVPVAYPQDVTTAEDASVPVVLTGFDGDSEPLSFRVVTPPSRGSLAGTAPDLVYTPFPNVNGVDTFTFVVNDGHVDSTPATVTVNVLPENDAPLAVNDSATTRVETSVVIAVLNNDTDVDGDSLVVSDVGAAANGTVVNNGTNVTYTPLPGFVGADTFTYTVADGHGGAANAVVTVTVSLTADPGNALRFNGASNFVRLAETVNIMAPTWTTTKTISLWVKPMGIPYCRYPEPTECDSLFGDRPQWWGITRGVSGGKDRIWIWNFDGNSDRVGIEYTAGEWIQVTMVHENGVLRAYKNGVLVGSVASGATRQPSVYGIPLTPVLTFGGILIGNANLTFEGEIDELRIWNVAKTAEEIVDEMNRELTGAELGLAAYYRMSDGSGTTVTDDSGHGWTGTLHDGYQTYPPVSPILWVPSGAFVTP